MKSFPSVSNVNSIARSQRRPSIPSLVSTRQRVARKSRLPCLAQQGESGYSDGVGEWFKGICMRC